MIARILSRKWLWWPRTKHLSPKALCTDTKNKACCWQADCYIANGLQFKTCQINRRLRQRFYAATGILSLAIHAVLGEIFKHHKTLVLGNFAAGFGAIAALILYFHLNA